MTSLCRHLSAQEIVNWVTTADGCVHTADANATKQFRPVGVGGVYWALDIAFPRTFVADQRIGIQYIRYIVF